MTFKELYLSGQVPFEEIDRYISRWNRSDDERTLAKYLGLNADEEDVWIDDSDEALKEMLDARERVAGTPVTLGKTDIIVNKNGFGALPIQRISFDDAKVLLRKAYDAGVRFFDTARFYLSATISLRTDISLFVMSLNSGVMITFCSMSITSRNSVTRSSFSVS